MAEHQRLALHRKAQLRELRLVQVGEAQALSFLLSSACCLGLKGENILTGLFF